MSINIVAQIIAVIAVSLMIASYFSTTKKQYLFLQIFCNIFYSIQFCLIGGFSAAGICTITLVKTVVFYFYTKKFDKIPFWLLMVFEIIPIIFGVLVVKDLLSAIPIVISCVYTYGTWQKNLKITYLIGSFAGSSWIIYSGLTGAYVAMIGSGLEILVSLIGQYRLRRKEKAEI